MLQSTKHDTVPLGYNRTDELFERKPFSLEGLKCLIDFLNGILVLGFEGRTEVVLGSFLDFFFKPCVTFSSFLLQ